jgi:hypothetical protein
LDLNEVNKMTILLFSVAIMAVVWFLVTGLAICDWLAKRSYKVNIVFLRLFLPVYVNQYKKLTTAENGRAGPLYYHWIVSINTALVFVAAAIISGLVSGI